MELVPVATNVEEHTMEWIEEHSDLLKQIGDELHAAGISHMDVVKHPAVNVLVSLAINEIRITMPDDKVTIRMEVQSFIANHMHNKQWIKCDYHTTTILERNYQ